MSVSDHHKTVFNHSCLKVPRNPVSQKPSPTYEQKYIHQVKNQARKLNLDVKNLSMKAKYSQDSERSVLKSLIEFYDSIPEYDEVNHLSNRDFYRQLENLKEKQRNFYDYIQHEIDFKNKGTNWIEDYKKLHIRKESCCKPGKPVKQLCTTPILNKRIQHKLKNLEEIESLCSSDKEIVAKPPSRRSVRIESPTDKCSPDSNIELERLRAKSRANLSSASSRKFDKLSSSYNTSAWDDISVNDFRSDSDRYQQLAVRSAPTSPVRSSRCDRGWKDDDGITIPKPFKMTIRDEENQIVDEMLLNIQKPKEGKPEMFRAHPVPIESKIPLFDKIVADQERRSKLVKKRSKENLKAQMRPFSFTRREEEMQALTRRLSKSTPSIFLDDIPVKSPQFRAKPVPKTLFSNYIYQKMHEDEFYRALQRKIRAEEMLKAASLPPSMAKREKTKPKYTICPRSFQCLTPEDELDVARKTRSSMRNYKSSSPDSFLKDLDEYKCDFTTNNPKSFKSRSAKLNEKRIRKCYGSSRNSSSNGSRNIDHYRASTAAELQSVNRSNLAAVLRIQSAKSRMEYEMCRKLEEAKLRDEARWREKVLRKRPAWQALTYSHEEDLAMRLQLRRDEERLRSQEHRHRMELMYGRVNEMPTLFERQSQQFPKHLKSRQDLIAQLQEDLGQYYNGYASPKRSETDTSTGNRSFLEMKDEEIQVKTDELLKEISQNLQNGNEKKDTVDRDGNNHKSCTNDK